MKFCVFPLVLGFALILESPIEGQEWPRFRGPNGSGIQDQVKIPATWDESGILWTVDLPGVGNGSPVVAGDRVFLLAGDPETSERIPLCLNAADGSVIWQKSWESANFKGHRFNTPASSTPALADERVYFSWGTRENLQVTALTHEGEEVWSVDLGPIKGGHGFAASPMVAGDLVVLNNDQEGGENSNLIALNRETGEVVWKIPRESRRISYSTPCLLGDQLIFTNWTHGFTAVDPATGEVTAEASVFGQEHNERAISSPVVAGPDLVIGTCGFTANPKHCIAMRLNAEGFSEVWRIERNVPHIPSVVVLGERTLLWDDNGIGTLVETATGEELWKERIGGNFFGSPVSDGSTVLAVDDAGIAVTIRAGDVYEELGRMNLGEECRSTPALGSGAIFIRTATKLTAIAGE